MSAARPGSRRVLVVSNDFPPDVGGIQSYARDYLGTLDAADVVVLASCRDAEACARFDAALPYPVRRLSGYPLLPGPRTARAMRHLIAQYGCTTVWFIAAAPLAALAPQARAAGATRVVASTHGHEVGWGLVPGARQVLRRIFRGLDAVSVISQFTAERLIPLLPSGLPLHFLPSGVDTALYAPVPAERRLQARTALAAGGGPAVAADAPLVVCVSRLVARKGQDTLIKAWPQVVERFPTAQLVIAGSGPAQRRLRRLRASSTAAASIWLMGAVSEEQKLELLAAADLFAMPCRTRWAGIDVEGLGIVYLEAQAAGLAVVAGDSGGAPETVPADAGVVVHAAGASAAEATAASIIEILGEQTLTLQQRAEVARRSVTRKWTWAVMGGRLQKFLWLDAGA